MPKVLFVVPHLSNSMRLLADYLRYLDRGFKVTLFVLEPEVRFEKEFPDDARRVFLDRGVKLTSPRAMWELYRETRAHDIVVCWAELTPTYVAALAGFMNHKPVIGWVHANLTRIFDLKQRPVRLHYPLFKLVYPRLSAVVGVSEGVRDDLQDNLKLPRAVAIVNGIDIERVRQLANEQIPDSLKPIFDRPVVINVAALHYQKDQELLLNAHRAVLQKGMLHNLLFVGDGPLRGDLEKKAADLGIAGSVFFAGYVDNPYPLIKNARTFALTSRWEGYALVLAEALALGVPVVSTDCPSGPAEILCQGRYGALVPAGDVEKLSAALEHALQGANDPVLSQEGAARHSIKLRVTEMENLFWATLKGNLN